MENQLEWLENFKKTKHYYKCLCKNARAMINERIKELKVKLHKNIGTENGTK